MASQLANALTVRLWGQLSDRLSNKAVLATLAPFFLLCLAALPFTATPDRNAFTLPLLAIVHLAMGIAAGGTALATGNIGLKLAPRGQGTAYMAAITLTSALASGIAPILGGLLANWFAERDLSVVIQWTTPGTTMLFTPVRLHHWSFFFLLAALSGLYALHALTLVKEESTDGERILVQDLVLEARRTMRSLSSVAGLRAATAFPFGRLVRLRTSRIRPVR